MKEKISKNVIKIDPNIPLKIRQTIIEMAEQEQYMTMVEKNIIQPEDM